MRREGDTADAEDLAVAVLAGGRSSRFGTDKRAARLRGCTLLERALRTAREVSPHVLLSLAAGAPGTATEGATPVFDATPDAGPLGGIVAVLRATTVRRVVFLPVDMPGVTAALLRALAARRDGRWVALRDGDREHPLPCCVDREILPGLEKALQEGRRTLRDATQPSGMTFVPLSDLAGPTDALALLANVNTRDDLDALQETAGGVRTR